MLAPLNHAVVKYENAPCCYRRVDHGGSGEEVTSSEGELSTPEKDEEEAGGFFFSDGGQGTDFAAALRIRMGEGNQDWPLTQVCCLFEMDTSWTESRGMYSISLR